MYRVAACFWLYYLCSHNKEQGNTTPQWSLHFLTQTHLPRSDLQGILPDHPLPSLPQQLFYIIVLFLIVLYIVDWQPLSLPLHQKLLSVVYGLGHQGMSKLKAPRFIAFSTGVLPDTNSSGRKVSPRPVFVRVEQNKFLP